MFLFQVMKFTITHGSNKKKSCYNKESLFICYTTGWRRLTRCLQTHLSKTNLFVTTEMRTWQNLASVARVTLFPEDGGVYTVERAPGLLTQLSANSPAAPLRNSRSRNRVVYKRTVGTNWDTVHKVSDVLTHTYILKAEMLLNWVEFTSQLLSNGPLPGYGCFTREGHGWERKLNAVHMLFT